MTRRLAARLFAVGTLTLFGGWAQDGPLDERVRELAAAAKPSLATLAYIDRDGEEAGVGAGFVVSEDGLIATCLHVIGEARPITVRLFDGRSLPVTEIYAWDRRSDLAIVRVAVDAPLEALPLEAAPVAQGDRVVALGNPLGYEGSVVDGVVSAVREIDGGPKIQVAMPIEPGNSGGPLLDYQGRVRGVVSMKSLVARNLGFAEPADLLQALLDRPNPTAMDRWLTIGALDPDLWRPLMGANWRQRSGRILVEDPGDGFGGRALCLFQEPPEDETYEAAVSVKLDDESGAAGLVFAADGGQRHYGFYPSAGQMRLTRFDGPSVYAWTILEQAASPHYRPGDWNHLMARVEPDRIRCFVNGEEIFSSPDAGLRGGRAGLAKFRRTKAQFRGFQMGPRVDRSRIASSEERAAILEAAKPLTDGSPRLAESAWEALARYSKKTTAVLRSRARALELESKRLAALADAFHARSAQDDVAALFDGADAGEPDLLEAALMVARLDNADVDVASYVREVERMAGEARQRFTPDMGAPEKFAALRAYLFRDQGYHGSRTDYYNRANSYINETIDDREGLPITLSVLYIAVAQRLGLVVEGVGLPGHFVVREAWSSQERPLVDVFDGGRVMAESEAAQIGRFQAGAPESQLYLKAATTRDIVVRMLRNLINAGGDAPLEESLKYLDLIVRLRPDSPEDRLSRARTRWMLGDWRGAESDLEAALARSPELREDPSLQEWLRSR